MRGAVRLLGTVCLVLTASTMLPAHDGRLADMVQTVHARRYLCEDEQLSELNLGLVVRNRVALLWGPVPSAALGQKAEARLRNLPGLTEVRNRLVVVLDDAPVLVVPVRERNVDSELPSLPVPIPGK